MKKTLLILILGFLFTGIILAQDSNEIRMPLIGEEAPAFKAESTKGPINFPDDYFGKWKILFSHPADFTPVCSTELLELANDQEEFTKLNTQIVVMSTDSKNSHIEWISSLEDIRYKEMETEEIDFPLVADQDLKISRIYGMIHPNSSSTRDVRGVFIIDTDDKIRAIFFYPTTTGRNIDEIKRTLIAMQLTDKQNIFTPANWQPGEDVLLPAPATKELADRLADTRDPKLTSLAWYIWFKKL
jgi:peroxiredoxin (alkyl hydroperoxide reductase subunit C)